ncbi:MAG TPA: hypothetical protein VFK39_14120, partial [Gemmatimonadaceae bacterium]|nr:hypothetical protein [Gemmatimonadaceae bacterium]
HTTTRSRLFRLAAIVLLVAEVVAVGLSPIAEGRVSADFPTHIETAGAVPHAGHHPGICAFCVLRHFSPLPTYPSGTSRQVAVHQSIRPEKQLAIIIVGHDRHDPARAPPSLPFLTTI